MSDNVRASINSGSLLPLLCLAGEKKEPNVLLFCILQIIVGGIRVAQTPRKGTLWRKSMGRNRQKQSTWIMEEI